MLYLKEVCSLIMRFSVVGVLTGWFRYQMVVGSKPSAVFEPLQAPAAAADPNCTRALSQRLRRTNYVPIWSVIAPNVISFISNILLIRGVKLKAKSTFSRGRHLVAFHLQTNQ